MFFSGPPSEETLEYIFRGPYTREDALQFSGSLMVDAARILCHDLLFTTEHLLHNANLEGIYDAYANAEEGYSFVSDLRNDFSREGWACDVQANIWSKPGIVSFHHSCTEFTDTNSLLKNGQSSVACQKQDLWPSLTIYHTDWCNNTKITSKSSWSI